MFLPHFNRWKLRSGERKELAQQGYIHSRLEAKPRLNANQGKFQCLLLQHLGTSRCAFPGRVQCHFRISFQPARDWRPPGCSISSQAAMLSCLLGSVALSFPRSSSRCPVQEDPQMPSGQIISFLQAGETWAGSLE